MSRVFITNGTGYIGEAVAKAFKQKGHDVTCMARSEDASEKLKGNGLKSYRGDLRDPKSLLEPCRSADIVIHTAATNDAEYGLYDNLAVETILEALKGSNKTFIYTSGTWLYGNTGDQVATEETPLNPIPFVSWRPDVEKKVLAAHKDGVRTIVLRPGLVYGNKGGIIAELMSELEKSGEASYLGDGENRWSTVHVDDCADLYVLANEKGKSGEVYNGTHGPAVKVKEVFAQVAKAAGKPGKVRSIPVDEARGLMGPWVDGLVLDQNIDSGKAKRELGWAPKRFLLVADLSEAYKQVALR